MGGYSGVLRLCSGGGVGRQAAAGLTAGDDEDLTAGGAGGVRSEPHVDAADVEAVAALGEDSDFVPEGELREADRTVGEFGGAIGGVGELGEGAEDLLLEALVGGRLSGGSSTGGRGGEAAEPSAASDGDEPEDAD